MHALAAASPAAPSGVWPYFAVFALMALAFAGIPAIGAAVVSWAAVLASQGSLNIAVVVVVALVGAEVGGLTGYSIGFRWGRKLLERPGPRQARRQQVVSRGEKIFTRWGWLAVFFISTIICGMLKMRHAQFVVWNFIDAAVYVLAVAPAAYGASKIASGEQDWGSLGPLIAGLAIAAGCAVLAVRYYRHRARQVAGPAAVGSAENRADTGR
jgi:membrane protein DedA with SNARE-associated domain